MGKKKKKGVRKMNIKVDSHCANCMECKVFIGKMYSRFWYVKKKKMDDGTKIPRVKCAKGHWVTRGGREKTYPLYSVKLRRHDKCPDYNPSGPEKPFLDELILPEKGDTAEEQLKPTA